ncbi:MAG: hypothetical protein A2749_02630 [Parcubacteria group bacterium RIFCSPHIGHO2_01_FULL_45_26]|nr:MAG: hypothetical protein A2749_02630 [Parcubacteria group bacterium RIFCSPHIGHO2_01_FULL_45_26]
MEVFVQLTLNGLIAGSLYAMLALGFNLLYGTVKFFDVAYGTVGLVAAYTILAFGRTYDLPIVLVGLVGVATAGLLNYLIYILVYKPLRTRKASSMVMLVASFGVFSVLQALIAMVFSSQFFSLRNSESVSMFKFAEGSVTDVQVITILFSLVVPLVLWLLLSKTKFGRAVRAVGDNEEVANIVGINSSKIVGWTFFLSAVLAGLAVTLVGLDRGVEPYMGLALLLKGIVASIVGGIGYVWGGVLGGFVLGLVENFGSWYLPSEWKDTIAFVVLVIFLLFRPRGILKR